MKKFLILTMFLLVSLSLVFAQTPGRTVQQKLILDPTHPQNILDYVTNTGITHSQNYILRVLHIESDIEKGTDLGYPASVIKIAKVGTVDNYYAAAIFNQSMWPAVWPEGSHVKIRIWYTGPATNPTGVEPYPLYEYSERTFEVPAGTGVVSFVNPGLEMIVPPYPIVQVNHIISGAITSQWDLTGVTISATDIDPANITYDAGAYTVTVPDGWDGTITPAKAGYIFEPAERTYTDVVADTPDQNFVMKTVVAPGVPTGLIPNAVTLTYAEPTAVNLTWDAVANAEGYKLQWNEGAIQDLGNVLAWTTPALGAGTYTWKVCAYNNTATKTITPVRVKINGRSTGNDAKADGGWAEASFIVEIVTIDFPEGTPIAPPGATVTVTITITGGSANNGTGVIPPFVNPSFVPVEQYIFDLLGAGPWTLTFNTTAQWAAYYLSGIWTAAQNIGGTITITINPTKDISGVPIVLGDVDPTLPVELSYFAATLTAENYVNIAWRTESSTDMLGYRIYRSMTENQSEAINITPVMIEAINSSNIQNYSHIDREVENGNTYYYWLEAVDYSNNSIFYETSPVYVDGPTTPELPNVTTMRNAYPNPFRAGSGTTIEVDVKAGDNGTVTVYNILGQVVKTFPVAEGINNLTWNARDSKGNLCGNGIYFYKLSTKTINQTKKMVIIK